MKKLFKRAPSYTIYDPTSLNEGRVIEQNLSGIIHWIFPAFWRLSTTPIFGALGMEAIQNQTITLGASANNFAH